MKRFLLFFGIIALFAATTGCEFAALMEEDDQPSTGQEGDVILQINLSSIVAQGESVGAVQAELSDDSGRSLRENLRVDNVNNTAEGVIQGVAQGEWSITITVYSPSGSVIGVGTGTVSVQSGQNPSVDITLRPGSDSSGTTGEINLVVVWADTGTLDLEVEWDNSGSGGTGTVQGTIRDATTGNGIGGVTVSVQGSDSRTTSGNDGSFTLEVSSGTQTVTFSLRGYSFPEMRVQVTSIHTSGRRVGSGCTTATEHRPGLAPILIGMTPVRTGRRRLR